MRRIDCTQKYFSNDLDVEIFSADFHKNFARIGDDAGETRLSERKGNRTV